MLPLSFNTNYDGKPITVLKQSAYHAIILAKILSYAPRAGFPQFLEAFSFSFLMTILPASNIVLIYAYMRPGLTLWPIIELYADIVSSLTVVDS